MTDCVMVSVVIATYNQECYLKDAIEGAIKQNTNFKYEILIVDDASTDCTQDIIREYEKRYPDVIKGIFHKENQFQYCKCGMFFHSPQIKGKYFALCDGDDYWTDENKLQKQVDFLESHDEYSMCMHNAVKWNCVSGEKQLLDTFPEDGTYSQEKQILAGLGTDFPTSSSYVLRTKFLKDIPDFFLEMQALDYSVRQYFACKGKVYYFKKPMSVYRVSAVGSYMTATAKEKIFYNNYTLQMIHFFEKFNQYTQNQFEDILQQKIISDYFGFCLSISKKLGIQKATSAGMNMDKIQKCYQLLDPNYLDNSIELLSTKVKSIFIYGTSRVAAVCKKQLEHAGVEFEGFVVSDNQMKPDFIEGKKVYHLNEVILKYKNPGFILAIQPVNIDVIENMLKQYQVKNYCKPYIIKCGGE